jgi:hypothetical protein
MPTPKRLIVALAGLMIAAGTALSSAGPALAAEAASPARARDWTASAPGGIALHRGLKESRRPAGR